ncbi:hypothetical protein ACWCOW_24670 [Streptomyces sp. NPDC001939]|uniref:hypothetical protein n=1 Tax=unclassified Streptomyces TaxID=2593676 RepID=UPI0022535CF8|nr:hypothetical protein [Streptomyces sp. NBC_00401]MCX5087210.1 hypothetical protein [Streptomyces sp. NBC_00401]
MTAKHQIDQDGGIDWESTIASCGLAITGNSIPSEARAPGVAILAATGGNVRPTATVGIKDSRSMETLDQLWDTVAKPFISPPHGEFLLILWGKGSISKGWFRVKDPLDSGMPSRICAAIGRPEFYALSLNGENLFAITVEEDDYWVITHKYDTGENCPVPD